MNDDTKKIVTLRGGPCDGEQIDSNGIDDIVPGGHHLPRGYTRDRKPKYTHDGTFIGYVDTSNWSEAP